MTFKAFQGVKITLTLVDFNLNKPSTYARTPIVNDTFYRRNGIHHRPIEL